MAETIADNAIIDSQETLAPDENPPIVPTIEEPAPKKRGRPAGARDKVPRVKKPAASIRIVEEPLVPAPEPEVARPKKKRTPPPPESDDEGPSEVPTPPVAQVAPEPVEPPSPRDMYREASQLIFKLQNAKTDTRRSHLQEQYTKGLLAV